MFAHELFELSAAIEQSLFPTVTVNPSQIAFVVTFPEGVASVCYDNGEYFALLPANLALITTSYEGAKYVNEGLARAHSSYLRDQNFMFQQILQDQKDRDAHKSPLVAAFKAAVAERKRQITLAEIPESPLIFEGDVASHEPGINSVFVSKEHLFRLRHALAGYLNRSRLLTYKREAWCRNLKKAYAAGTPDTTSYVIVDMEILTSVAERIQQDLKPEEIPSVSTTQLVRVLGWLYFKRDVYASPGSKPFPDISTLKHTCETSRNGKRHVERLNDEVIDGALFQKIQSRTPIHDEPGFRLPKDVSIRTRVDRDRGLHCLIPAYTTSPQVTPAGASGAVKTTPASANVLVDRDAVVVPGRDATHPLGSQET
jgi:hypothetical protein